MKSATLIEAALARRLRTRLDYRRAGLGARIADGGGVVVQRGDAIFGYWFWCDNAFEFRSTPQSGSTFKASTIFGASTYTSTIVGLEILEPVDDRSPPRLRRRSDQC